MFRTMARGGLLAAVLLASAASAPAHSFDDIDIEFEVGAGPNQAVVIVDWKSLTPGQVFAKAFSFRWSGTAYSSDILYALAAEPTFSLKWKDEPQSVYGLGWDASGNGVVEEDPLGPDWYEEGFGFPELGVWEHWVWIDSPAPGDPDQDPGWRGPDTTLYPETFSPLNSENAKLTPGDLEGWSWAVEGPPSEEPDIPQRDDPVIPEPATLLLLSLGLGALACRRRGGSL